MSPPRRRSSRSTMPSPRRRSSRLRGSSGIGRTPAKQSNTLANRLDSVAERDETPTHGPQSNLDEIVSSPLAPRTPVTAGRIKPGLEEMHPSKAHQSTTEQPDSGLRLGFTDIGARGNNQPSGIGQQTPSKVGISSPSFDFRFARPGPQLGPEAQRMMDELREEALRIKARLVAEQAEKRQNGGDETGNIGSRKFAQAKGKVGRFSDIHMAEFKKMDSIAGHPSSFRALPTVPATKSLKRTQSKAKLDDRNDSSKKAAGKVDHTERLENTAPAKRIRQHVTDDTSSARPISRDSSHATKAELSTPRSQSSVIASITTPTQASLARTASVKHPGTQIPTLSKSPSKPNLISTASGLKKSATIGNFSSIPRSESKSHLQSPSRFDRVKSILRYPSLTPKNVPSSTSSLPRSTAKPDLDKILPSLPTTPGTLHRSKSLKQVNFTPDAVDKHVNTIENSPSPVKSGIPRSKSRVNLNSTKPSLSGEPTGGYPTTKEVEYPSIAGLAEPSKAVEYPSLANVHPFLHRGTPHPKKTQPAAQSVPSTFTFRSDKTINFGASPKGFGSSPGQATLRQVRPSIIPNAMTGAFPCGNKENTEPLPSVPHGMANKKRRRVDSDEETVEEDERSPKKQKAQAAKGQILMAPRIMAEEMAPASNIPSPAKKKGLSLSRLNMLARPKMRK